MKIHALPGRQSGFSLLENLIAVVLLSIGAIGIGLSTATTIKINSDNLQRAMALNAASIALENLYIASLSDDGATLRIGLDTFTGADGALVSSNPNTAGSDRDQFVVRVTQAVDAAGRDVLTNAAPYVSPVTVGVQVDYEGNAGNNVPGVEEVKSALTSFTFVLGL
jgi:prepilin-type N-terminal cleavage/methylation domain-containing protein